MASSDVTPSEKDLTCPICLDVFTSPRLLPCYHTFCLLCIDSLITASNGNSFHCPSCRRHTDAPPGGAAALQTNFYITEDELRDARDATLVKCKIHKKDSLRFYCVQCDEPICASCKLTHHEGHKTEDIAKVVASSKQKIKQLQQKLQTQVDDLVSLYEKTRRVRDEAFIKRRAVEQVVQDEANEYIHGVNRMIDRFQQQAEKRKQILEVNFTLAEQQMNADLENLSLLQHRALRVMQNEANDVEVVLVGKELSQRETLWKNKLIPFQESVFRLQNLLKKLRLDYKDYIGVFPSQSEVL